MPTWRSSLPQQSDQITFRSVTPLLRTEMEIGPPKVRLRSSKEQNQFTVGRMVFSKIQVDEFLDFWETDLGGGALSFTWEHPITDAAATVRFITKPVFEMHNGGDTAVRRYLADLELELL